MISRPWLYFLLALTAIALLPWDPHGPFDARDWSPLDGVHLDYPWSGVALEPLLAPAHALTGAPDFRIALVSTVAWLLVLAMLAGALTGRGPWRRLGRSLAFGAVALGSALLYVVFMALLHLPGWRLVADDPNLLVADLQTHTFGSHDGLVTAEQNLAWHRARGYELIAITEHNDPRGSFAMQALAHGDPAQPAVIAGVEVSAEEDEYLLGLGIDPQVGVLPWRGNQKEFARKFIDHVHAQGGAVVALAWKLEPRHVHKLAALGLDGIELVNTGHPDIPDPVREAMLQVAASHGVVPVASTDWHGWGGFSRTWTLVRGTDVKALGQAERAAWVIDRLRARDGATFIPVAAGYMGPPGLARAVFAPWVEAVRYAAELSPARVASWWAWAVVLAALARALARRGWQAAPVIAAAAAMGVGAAVTWRAAALVGHFRADAGLEYAMEMGEPALWIGGLGVAAGLAAVWRLSARRRPRSG
ncbi:MAG: PHP domain-containing protein [Thiohalomonadaceae bacterium]